MTAQPAIERIANLGVVVKWRRDPPARSSNRLTSYSCCWPVQPLFGPLAGCLVGVSATTAGSWGHGWHLRLLAFRDGARWADVVAVPESAEKKAWPGPADGAGEAKAAAARLLHGDTEGLAWRPIAGRGSHPGPGWQHGWRLMADLAGWVGAR